MRIKITMGIKKIGAKEIKRIIAKKIKTYGLIILHET